jgi:hypothetical protein
MDAIARRIDLLLDARTTPDGYKMIVEGGDPLKNCTELDKIKILEKSMNLIAALTSALKSYPTKIWPGCCEDACNACKLFATPYKPRQVQRWWSIFKINYCFPHPRGEEANTKKSKDILPPFLCNNEDLHQKLIKHCMTDLCDLTIDMAKEYITDTLIPMAYPLTSKLTVNAQKELLCQQYQLSDTPSRSTVWEWQSNMVFPMK